MSRVSAVVRRQVAELYFPQLGAVEMDALAAAVSGEDWCDAQQLETGVGALSHAAELAPLVPEIDSVEMVSMLAEVLLVHASAALRNGVIDNDFLEQITETDDRFEHWRSSGGGALDATYHGSGEVGPEAVPIAAMLQRVLRQRVGGASPGRGADAPGAPPATSFAVRSIATPMETTPKLACCASGVGARSELADASWLLGVLACRGGDADSGARAIERALDLSPGNTRYLAALADALLLQQRADDAQVLYCRAFPRQAADLEGLTDAGLPWKRTHPDLDSDSAAGSIAAIASSTWRTHTRRTRSRDEVEAGHLLNWALVLVSQRRVRQAISLLQQAVMRDRASAMAKRSSRSCIR